MKGDDHCVADLDASGNPIASYTWGTGIDNLLAVTVHGDNATNTYYAIKDHLNSVHALVNESGSTVMTVNYNAWGEPLNSSLSIQNSSFRLRYLFQGREYSHASGLYNFRARWYSSDIGRWLSKDPIGLEGGLNLYVAFGNNPVNFVDPWGERITVTGAQKQSIVSKALSQFARGQLSFDNKSNLRRKKSKKDGEIENHIDSLIDSKNTYEIIPESKGFGGSFEPWSKVFGDFDWQNNIGRGGEIYFDPSPPTSAQYKTSFWGNREPHTGGTIFAHELLGRAVGDNNKENVGKLGSKTRRKANSRAVKRANPAFDRMGKPRRYKY